MSESPGPGSDEPQPATPQADATEIRSAPATAFVLGLVGGCFSGFLGLGAGYFLVPGLSLLLRVRGARATGTALAVTLPAALVGAAQYGVRDWAAVGWLALGSVVGALIGTIVAVRFQTRRFRQWFGLPLVALGFLLIAPNMWKPLGLDAVDATTRVGLLLGGGLLSGALCGAMHLSGGLMMVPVMVLGLGFGQTIAQGISLAVTLPVSLTSATLHLIRRNIVGSLTLPLTAGAVLGTALFAFYARSVGDSWLRLCFGLFLAAIGAMAVLRRLPTQSTPRDEIA